VRVYGMYATPVGKKNLPAVLHIHGGGQTAYVGWLEFWAGRGYAAMSFNWGGEWANRERFTLWGKLIQGNHGHFSDKIDPTPHVNSWYHWTLVSRRALTYLENQPEVDPEHIGAFGISMGGTIMWYLAMDKRIKAGCAIYGIGWNTRQLEPKYSIDTKSVDISDEILRWESAMAPEAYAKFVEFPMLFLSSTNDAMPKGVPRCQAFTPRYLHHIGPEEGKVLGLWMDMWLKEEGKCPNTPDTKVEISTDDTPIIRVIPDNSQEIDHIEVLYALENTWTINRFWRTAQSNNDGNTWIARTPVMDIDKYLFAYASVYYKSGICLSSKLEAVIPAKLGATKATDKASQVIYDGSDGVDGWAVNSPGTDPIPPVSVHIHPASGPEGRKGFNVFKYSSPLTYALGDPKWRGIKDAVLQFDIATIEGEDFIVILYEKPFAPNSKEYHAEVSVKGDANWQTINLSASQLHEKDSGTILENWSNISTLELKLPQGRTWNDSNIVFSNFRWLSD
jgi:hypothetical protein